MSSLLSYMTVFAVEIFVIFNKHLSTAFPLENVTRTAKTTTVSASLIDLDSTILKSLLNISNSPPELIEYYEMDDELLLSSSPSSTSSSSSSTSPSQQLPPISLIITTTSPPDIIYPDPEEFNRKIKITTNTNHINVISENNDNYDSNVIDDNNGGYSSIDSIDYNRDNDFKGHDLIDNIMYIYYGSQKSMRNSIGSSIVIGGCVLGLAAQILCLILMILRNRRIRRQNALCSIFLNFVIILMLSNLIFVLGVQATRSEFRCGLIAIVLHYLHLSTSIWVLIYVYIIYDYIANDCGINLKYNYFMAYGVPAVYVLFSCALSSTSYETIEYCWMSVHRGMIVNFMIPVSVIIIASTALGTLCLREIANKQREVIAESIENILENAAKCQEINVSSVIETDKCCEFDDRIMMKKSSEFYDSKFDLGVLSIVDLSLQSSADAQDFSDFKRSIKFWVFFQPAFALCWFFGTIALENRHSCVMPVIFVMAFNILNWYLLIRSPYICPIIQDQNQKEKFQTNANITTDEMQHQPSVCTDTIPLLCAPPNSITTAATIQNCKITNVVVEDISADSLGDISCNLDSISTISN